MTSGAGPSSEREQITVLQEELKALARAVNTLARREDDDRPAARSGG
ncbi:hypothetical protein LKL35_36855 [Streptomyces sp. ET3-23]|nr:hypothetical protein [Streptomyces sp. ET3-23]MCC2280895.1 hypothetical protein [Streptomyces sp. ET3-23]